MSGDREKVVAALATKAGVEGYCNISALKTYFYEAYDAGRRSMANEAADGMAAAAERLVDKHASVSDMLNKFAAAIRSLADGGTK